MPYVDKNGKTRYTDREQYHSKALLMQEKHLHVL